MSPNLNIKPQLIPTRIKDDNPTFLNNKSASSPNTHHVNKDQDFGTETGKDVQKAQESEAE